MSRLLLPLLVLLVTSVASAEETKSFSAETLTTLPGKPAVPGRLYVSGKRMRIESQVGQTTTTALLDPEKGSLTVLLPGQKKAVEMAGAVKSVGVAQMQQDPSGNPCAKATGATCKGLGAEKVDGRDATKWQVTKDGKTSTVWVDTRLHFTLKSVGADGAIFEMKNVTPGNQPESLFAVPADYERMKQ